MSSAVLTRVDVRCVRNRCAGVSQRGRLLMVGTRRERATLPAARSI